MPEPYDILIAGGGINGCGIACDAASRGLHVCLAEGGDLAQGTSSASSKLIHGGLRYLEQYEFRLVREALTEREILMRMAPHIVRPMRFVLPHAPGMRPKWMLRLGLFLYDWLGKRVTLPASHGLDLAQDEAGAPLQPQYRSGFEYSDCYADDARLTILNARAAANRGATILTRTNVAAARREDGIWIVRLAPRDADPLEVRTRMLVNAAGPWAGRLAGDLPHGEASPRLRLVQGAHIVIPALYGHGKAYIFQNHDRRIVFAIPFEEEFTLIGTTDTEFSGDPAKSKPLASEIDYLLAAVNAYFRRQLQTSDVVWTFAGVRALADDVGGTAQTASRDYRLEVDAPEGEAPLLTVLGGKITSYRTLAAHAMEKLAAASPHETRLSALSRTGEIHLPGGDLPPGGLGALESQLRARHTWLPVSVLRRWLRSYGGEAGAIAAQADRAGGPGRDFGAGLYEAEVRWAMAHEWARTADDILWRRTKLGLHFNARQTADLQAWIDETPR